jgi:hypothetical protein
MIRGNDRQPSRILLTLLRSVVESAEYSGHSAVRNCPLRQAKEAGLPTGRRPGFYRRFPQSGPGLPRISAGSEKFPRLCSTRLLASKSRCRSGHSGPRQQWCKWCWAPAVRGTATSLSFRCKAQPIDDRLMANHAGGALLRVPLRGSGLPNRKRTIMRNSAKLITALSVAALVGVAGSAFTATSTIDDSAQFVGSTTQAISGVDVTSVAYITNAADETSGVSFHVSQILTGQDTVTATITGTPLGGGAVTTQSKECVPSAAVAPATGTELSCTFDMSLENVTKLDIVAS